MIEKIIKRDGRIVPFDKEKITFAILRAAVAVGGRDRTIAEGAAAQVVGILNKRFGDAESTDGKESSDYPTVEEVQVHSLPV